MVSYEILTVDTPKADRNPCVTPRVAHEYTPLSLNHLVQEGIRWHHTSGKKEAQFELNLADDLYKTLGEPTQLRRLFVQLVDCLIESPQQASSDFEFTTQNITITANLANLSSQYGGLGVGIYVLLRVAINNFCFVPDFETDLPVVQTKKTNIFAWTQIYEVIQMHGGKIFSTHPDSDSTTVEIVLPALQLLH